jgi:hypothetical protein
MAFDPAIKDHQAWLGYLQPDGLVVSAAALVDAQVLLDRNNLPLQQRFAAFVAEAVIGDADPVPAIINFSLFVRGPLDWPEDCLYGISTERPLPDSLIIELKELGETLSPTFAFKDSKPKDTAQPWLLLVKVLLPGTDLDAVTTGDQAGWSASQTRRFERLLRETRVPIGVLSNGTHIRLVYAPHGENSGTLTFPVSAMTEVAGRPILGALEMLLGRYRLLAAPSEARLPALLHKSREYQSRVSATLAGQVLEGLYELLRGFQAADERTKQELLRELLAHHPDDIYGGLLTVLMRLVFLLFAEDRGLMPGSSLYQQNYSIHGLFERLRADQERYPDTMDQRYGAWAQLLALYHAVYDGCNHPHMKMPGRRGHLFDPDRFPFLEGRTTTDKRLPLVSDGVVFRVLRNLLILDGERLSYRTLDVEQIGSVYETMMGFKLRTADGISIALKPAKAHGAPTPINVESLLAAKPADRAKWVLEHADVKLTDKVAGSLKSANTIDAVLAALDSRMDRRATPHRVSKGTMLLVPSDERRRSGSHYTPRSMTGPIVRKALAPILKRLGDNPKPEQILDLKVCDLAMGSGALLVEGCRQLAEVLVKAWHAHDRMPPIPPDEDEILHARRIIAQRCLYGVDRNPMAVDLAKLSLWLATLAKDHPFTFLDHNLRCGDSLVGLTRQQIVDFHWLPIAERRLGQQHIDDRIQRATAYRKRILDAGDALPPDVKLAELRQADGTLDPVRFFADLVIAAFFAGENEKQRKLKRNEILMQLTAYLSTMDVTLRPSDAVKRLHSGKHPISPFHWEIEFPEVFGRENPGFDVIIGNPPFVGGTRISTANGDEYLDWIKTIHEESHGNADLVAHFFRRAFVMLRQGGSFGLIATNTIAQGDTRATGLRWIRRHDGVIYSAERRYKWPGEAAVVVSVVHVCRGESQIPARRDGIEVGVITAFLFHAGPDDHPSSLRSNSGLSFKGSDVYGMGFTFDDTSSDGTATPLSVMRELVAKEPRNKERIFPFTGGEELNDQPTPKVRRYIIGFGEMSESEAQMWPDLYRIVEEKVKPVRLALPNTQSARSRRERWWQWSRSTPELYEAIRPLKRVIAASQISSHLGLSFVPSTWTFSHGVNVFKFEHGGPFAVLQCRVHEVWARFLGSSMKDDLRYTPTDCFETFPFVEQVITDPALESLGQAYYDFRAATMLKNDEGLTKTYNRFHDPDDRSADILKLRELHAAMDRVVLNAYGWTDIPTDCQFLLDYEEDEDETADGTSSPRRRKKPWRYRWPDAVRDEVLARLLALNEQRHIEEVAAGLHGKSGKPVKAVARKSAAAVPKLQPDAPLFAPMAYPTTDTDRLICAASLATIEQTGGVHSMDHLNILLLASHSEWCREFLGARDKTLLDQAIAKAPAALFVGKNDSIRWKECRDYLELRKAIRVDHGATEQPIGAGEDFAAVKATLPEGVNDAVALAIKALNVAQQVGKDATKASPEQKRILSSFRQQAQQLGLVAA